MAPISGTIIEFDRGNYFSGSVSAVLDAASFGLLGTFGRGGKAGAATLLRSSADDVAEQFVRSGVRNAPKSVTMVGNTVLTASDDLVRLYASKVKSVPGFTNVFIHGTADGNAFAVLHNGAWVTLNHRSLATFLRSEGISGNIRLISCNSGAGTAAQNLANKLGVTVKAPTNAITVHANGSLTAPAGTIWRDFSPGVKP